MGTRLYVEYYHKSLKFHYCKDEYGNNRRVDLTKGADKTLADADPESLCGRYVDCDDIIPYLELGIGVRLVEEKEKE